MNSKLSYSIRKRGDITILDLHGKIIGSWACNVKEELLRLKDSGVSTVILNFQGVTSIDSLGVMAIISALEAGLTIKIIHMNTTCKDILMQNRATDRIPVYGTEEEALGEIYPSTTITKEMRRYKRISTNIPIEILIDDYSQRGVLLNVSEGGALIGYLDPLAVEPYMIRNINIVLKLPFLGSIELEGKPVRFGRSSEMHLVGVELLPSEKSRNLVKKVQKGDKPTTDPSSYSYE